MAIRNRAILVTSVGHLRLAAGSPNPLARSEMQVADHPKGGQKTRGQSGRIAEAADEEWLKWDCSVVGEVDGNSPNRTE